MNFINYEDIKDKIVITHDMSEFSYIIVIVSSISYSFDYGDYSYMYIPKNIINYITLDNTKIYDLFGKYYYQLGESIKFSSDKNKFDSIHSIISNKILFINDKKLYSKLKLIG